MVVELKNSMSEIGVLLALANPDPSLIKVSYAFRIVERKTQFDGENAIAAAEMWIDEDRRFQMSMYFYENESPRLTFDCLDSLIMIGYATNLVFALYQEQQVRDQWLTIEQVRNILLDNQFVETR